MVSTTRFSDGFDMPQLAGGASVAGPIILISGGGGMHLDAADLMAGPTFQLKASTTDLSHWAGLGDFAVDHST